MVVGISLVRLLVIKCRQQQQQQQQPDPLRGSISYGIHITLFHIGSTKPKQVTAVKPGPAARQTTEQDAGRGSVKKMQFAASPSFTCHAPIIVVSGEAVCVSTLDAAVFADVSQLSAQAPPATACAFRDLPQPLNAINCWLRCM